MKVEEQTEIDLKKLLETENDFGKIADCILNKYKLVLKNGKEFRICEIEFYLKSAEHVDTFTHCNPVQLTSGKWYMHRTNNSNPMSFKAGTYKCMDLSFGNESKKIYGGILIRSIMDLSSS